MEISGRSRVSPWEIEPSGPAPGPGCSSGPPPKRNKLALFSAVAGLPAPSRSSPLPRRSLHQIYLSF